MVGAPLQNVFSILYIYIYTITFLCSVSSWPVFFRFLQNVGSDEKCWKLLTASDLENFDFAAMDTEDMDKVSQGSEIKYKKFA